MGKTIFVSSTYQDLAEHRRAVWDLLEEFDVNVRGMEAFGARTETPIETCIAEVEQSDIFIGLIGFRLGTINEQLGKSFTQCEYERARELNLEILIYFRDDNCTLRPQDIDLETMPRERLSSFKRILREKHTIDKFDQPDDLVTKLKRDLQRHVNLKREEATTNDFELSCAITKRFLLLPQSFSGREIRLRIKITEEPFPASRNLCKAFNLTYGATIGVGIKVIMPAGEPLCRFTEIFVTGRQAIDFLGLHDRDALDLLVRLQFSPEDIPSKCARFLEEYIYFDEEPEDFGLPFEYIPSEGRVILLFSKLFGE